jgi:hypothetical protein
MPSYKFRIGQLVQLAPAISRNVPGGSYEVIKKLPESRGEFEYRIKSMTGSIRSPIELGQIGGELRRKQGTTYVEKGSKLIWGRRPKGVHILRVG